MQEQYLKKKMGFWSLTALSLGGIIGSSWLFGPYVTAQLAGPSAIISWLIGAGVIILIALIYAELGRVKPETGGLGRYPIYSHGKMLGALTGYSIWLGYCATAPVESAGIIQYANQFYPHLYDTEVQKLTAEGITAACFLMAFFVLFNYWGVRLFAITNTFITILKFIVPVLTIVIFLFSGFHPENFTSHGFAPNGIGASLSAILTSGIFFAYTGFGNVVMMGGEVVNPKRNIPLALITSLVAAAILYIALQAIFIGAVPPQLLEHGWSGIKFDSPFANLAIMINMVWLSWIITADAMFSPTGSALSYTAGTSRHVFGMAKSGFLPQYFEAINKRFGVPTRALILNFVIGLLFLFPLKSWSAIIAIVGAISIFKYASACVTVMVFRKVGFTKNNGLPAMQFIAPLAFVLATLLIYWTKWAKVQLALTGITCGVIAYLILHIVNKYPKEEFLGGIYFIFYIFMLVILSYLGNFGGIGILPEPYMSIIVAISGYVFYYFAVCNGVWYMKKQNIVEKLNTL
ncbi:APC family permease [Acinetobacter rathckeae]|uniref:APC family permease n=1 Tax=Acinetobacter rathckeae TaxID=2605272 RepID=UPI0018A2C5F7|nr:APC family permease [Acinetobacter rathckeae]MBF7687410.1 APC family permease [Acinetobacter rathckeae]MBF7694811.1 APC family permease [Acinetobacter rathckeae]